MKADALPLIDAERTGAIPDPAGNADPTDIVDETGPTECDRIVIGQAGRPRRIGGDGGHTGGVTTKVRRLEIGEVGDRGQRRVQLDSVDPPRRCGLGVQDRGAGIVADLGQPALPTLDQGIDHGRVMGVTAPIRQHPAGGLPAVAGPQLRVARRRPTTRIAIGTPSPARPAG